MRGIAGKSISTGIGKMLRNCSLFSLLFIDGILSHGIPIEIPKAEALKVTKMVDFKRYEYF